MKAYLKQIGVEPRSSVFLANRSINGYYFVWISLKFLSQFEGWNQVPTVLANDNLVPRAHVSFGQRQDTELWNNQPDSKILGFPVSWRMRTLV